MEFFFISPLSPDKRDDLRSADHSYFTTIQKT